MSASLQEQRGQFFNSALEAAKAFAKAVLTFASGAFGVTFIFLKEIAPHPVGHSEWLLAIAWVGFTVSILAVVFAFFFSQKASLFEISNVDLLANEKPSLANQWTIRTENANIVALVAIVGAMMTFSFFAVINLVQTEGIMVRQSFTPPEARGAETPVAKTFTPPAATLPPAERSSNTSSNDSGSASNAGNNSQSSEGSSAEK